MCVKIKHNFLDNPVVSVQHFISTCTLVVFCILEILQLYCSNTAVCILVVLQLYCSNTAVVF